MDTVNGNDILLFLADDDTTPTAWYPIMCLTSLTWGRTKSTTQTKTKCGTFDSEGSTDYTSTMSGIIIENPDNTDIGHKDLIDLFTGAVKRLMRIAPASPVAGNIIRQFKATLSALNDVFPTDGFATFDGTVNPDPTTVSETVYDGNIVLTTNAVAAGNLTKNSTNNILYIGKIAATDNITLNSVAAVLSGTYASGDLGNVKAFINDTPDLTGTPVQLGTSTDAAAMSTSHTFTWATLARAISTGSAKYILITADILTGAATGHTVKAAKPTFNITAAETVTDSMTDTAGTKTVA